MEYLEYALGGLCISGWLAVCMYIGIQRCRIFSTTHRPQTQQQQPHPNDLLLELKTSVDSLRANVTAVLDDRRCADCNAALADTPEIDLDVEEARELEEDEKAFIELEKKQEMRRRRPRQGPLGHL